MSSFTSTPDPCLVAILLICQTRSGTGPQIVHHYPQDPFNHDPNFGEGGSNASDDNDDASSSDSEVYTSEDDLLAPIEKTRSAKDQAGNGELRGSSDEDQDSLLGFSKGDIVSLLAPDRAWNKRKFELSINDLTFISRPVFARLDGSWKKARKSKKSPKPQLSEVESSTEEEIAEPKHASAQADNVPLAKSPLVMFNMVFCMAVPPLDHAFRVKEMYENVVRRFSRALRWEQIHHDYMWNEIDHLLRLKSKSPDSRPASSGSSIEQSAAGSSLAKAMATVFNSISASKIASVTFSPGVSMSLQIQPATSVSSLPSLGETPLPPGLWLTTATETHANASDSDMQSTSTALEIAKSQTLLLKHSPHRIARDAQAAGGPFAAHLPKFVAELRPTKSFFKVSQLSHISLGDISLLARHLIYWRRAIAIPPLHQFNTYILSPNADLRKLKEASSNYEAQFPASLPSLPKLLSMLSGIPQPFRTFVPSPDHKDIYMLVLAWLLRNGWVTQLRTFAYVRVDQDIKRGAHERHRESTTSFSVSRSFPDSGTISSQPEEQASRDVAASARPSFVSRRSSDGRQSLKTNGTSATSDKAASLIMNPQKASAEESRWLSVVADRLSMIDQMTSHGTASSQNEEQKEELKQYWPILNKYFDGRTALEDVPVKAGLKRRFIWDLYSRMGLDFESGVEDSEGKNGGILVSVRHW